MKRAFSATSGFCLVLALVAPGLAQGFATSETVTIQGANALPGIWKFPPHERRSAWRPQGSDVAVKFEAVGPEKYCRIGRADPGYTLNCLEIAERSPRASLGANGKVYLAWSVLFGVSGCHWTFEGRLQSSTVMSGHLGMRCGMVIRYKPEPLTLTKMTLSEKTPDTGGHAAFLGRLLEQMASGQVAERYVQPRFVSSDPAVKPLPDEVQLRLMQFLTPTALRLLGKTTAVVYVGDYTPIVGWSYGEATPVYSRKRSSIYAVEFENGERLCALHRRADGVLDHFQCI